MSVSGDKPGSDNRNYDRGLMSKFTADYDRRRNQEAPTTNQQAPHNDISPLNVELSEFYSRDNAKSHHTDQFELVVDNPATPILRRGLPFYFAVRLDRPYDAHSDIIRLQFSFGPKPAVPKGTRIILPVTDKKDLTEDKNRWDVRVHHQDGNNVTFQVQIPAGAQVGLWRCAVRTNRKGRTEVGVVHDCDVDVYILFNPWCKEDTVYLDNEKQRQEYVLNDTGKVWTGSYRQPKGRRWIFGQFDDVILPAIVYLMERSKLAHTDRGNPVQMVRAISAVINSPNEDGGLLVGKWKGDYKDGVAPHAWTGSVAILEKFLQDGGKSVQYGQCWVFSAVTVTVCRALGIPCRSVTNYVSAHDTDNSLTVDKFFTRDGEEIQGGPDGTCHDSYWNFHVWNDVWMQRPDLPQGYGGWQAIDATPQETSGSLYQCGPASVEAVRRGDVGFSYDTPFVFAEVNADMCHFREDDASEWGYSQMRVDKYHVGKRIITKSAECDDDVGDADLEDITHLYKNPEGSDADHTAAVNAARGVARAPIYNALIGNEGLTTDDVFFDLVEIDDVPFGQNFKVTVHIHNKSSSPRTISAVVAASSVRYTGATAYRLKKAQGEFVVQPRDRESLQIKVTPQEYIGKIVDQSLVKLYAFASVKETNQKWSEEDDFPLLKPKLQVQIRGSPTVGEECHADISFQSPLAVVLTDCAFNIEGPGLQRPKLVPFRDVRPGELVTFTEAFRPKKAGETKIVATFNSDQLNDVAGSTTVHVRG